MFFQEIAKALPQDRKLLDPLCIRLSETLKIGLLRNQLNRQVDVAQSLDLGS